MYDQATPVLYSDHEDVESQSGCHMAFADDSLNVNCMNSKEGGCQPLMRDTIFEGKQIAN